jgi:hypothetical protein
METVEQVAPVIDKWKLFDLMGYKVHHPEVRRFHNSTARIKVCSAPRRSTKSYAAAKDALACILMPNTRTWIVGPNYGLAEKEFRYIHEDLVLKRNVLGLPKPKVCQTNARSGQLYIKFPWGSIVECKSADNPESLLGEAVDQVIYSEAAQLPRHIRERYVQPTVITKKGTEIVPTTPDQGGEWVHELIEKAQREDFSEIGSFHWDVTANPTYDLAEFERAKKFYGADSPVFREQYLGEWVFYGGRVYGTFDESVHIIKPFDIPRDWPIIRGIDFGHRDPFVTLWCAVGPEQELYFFKEYYSREGKSIREHAAAIKMMSEHQKVMLTVGDPAAKQAIDDLCFEGIPTISGDNDRQAGRMRVLEYLQMSDDGVPPWPIRDLPARYVRSRWPRMYVFDTLKEWKREMRYYRWHEGAQREGDREKTEGEDHAMDPTRYICMTRPSPYKMTPRVMQNSFKGWLNKITESRSRTSYIGG